MPLAYGEGGISVAHEDLGDHSVFVRHFGVVSRKTGSDVCDATHSVGVVIAPGEQGSACRRAQRGGMEVAVSKATCGQGIKGRSLDVAAITAELRKADVIEQHHDDVG